jgi:alanine dehydrogenase
MPTNSASGLLDMRASACSAVKMRRSMSSTSTGRTSFGDRAVEAIAFVDPSPMPRSYRIIVVKIAITSQILHNLGKTQYELRSFMRVGIPTEIKNNEFRVAITPAGVAELVHRGHEVIIQSGAGEGSAISDADFKRVGAQLINGADQVWAEAELLLKVKEPIGAEYGRMHRARPCSLSAPRGVQAVHRCAARLGHRRSRTKPCRPPTARCRCWPR